MEGLQYAKADTSYLINTTARSIPRKIHTNMERQLIDYNEEKIQRLNEKCLELEERVTFLEATIYKFRITLEPGQVKADDIQEFCDLVDDYFNSMEAIKGGNKIGLA